MMSQKWRRVAYTGSKILSHLIVRYKQSRAGKVFPQGGDTEGCLLSSPPNLLLSVNQEGSSRQHRSLGINPISGQCSQ